MQTGPSVGRDGARSRLRAVPTDQLPEQHAEVEAREVNSRAASPRHCDVTRRCVRTASRRSRDECVIDRSIRSPRSPHQALASGPPDAPTIRIDGRVRSSALECGGSSRSGSADTRPLWRTDLQIHHDLITDDTRSFSDDQCGERLGVVQLEACASSIWSAAATVRGANDRRIPCDPCPVRSPRRSRRCRGPTHVRPTGPNACSPSFRVVEGRIRIHGALPVLIRASICLPLPALDGRGIARQARHARRLAKPVR